MNTQSKKKRAETNGRIAEYVVALSYMLRGYRLIARRYRCHSGEIDLIMGRGGTRLFIEVKFRKKSSLDTIETALPPRQRKRIHAAAQYYLGRERSAVSECHIHIVMLRGWFGWQVFADGF